MQRNSRITYVHCYGLEHEVCCSISQDGTSENDAEGDSLEATMNDDRKKRDVDMADYFEFLSESGHESEVEEDIPSISDTANEDFNTASDDYITYYDDQAATMSEDQTYDSETDLPEFVGNSRYSLELVEQRRRLRSGRSTTVNHLELPEATKSTLMAHINESELKIGWH